LSQMNPPSTAAGRRPDRRAFALPRSARAQAPKPGGTLVSAQTSEGHRPFDPQLVPALSRSRRSPLDLQPARALRARHDASARAAESWQVSPDGLHVDLQAAPRRKFHDGQEFTSADVKFTFDRLLEKSASGKSDFSAVDKVERPASTRSSFVTKEPFAALVAALGASGLHRQRGRREEERRRPQQGRDGTGPFMLETGRSSSRWSSSATPTTSRRGCPSSTS